MDRVQLHLQHGVTRTAGWRCAPPESYRCRYIYVGYLADGRWFADHTGMRGGAYLCDDQAAAEALAGSWRVGGDWWDTPAQYGADGKPTEPGWVRRGGTWFREVGAPGPRDEGRPGA
jgi:hypothetical protein